METPKRNYTGDSRYILCMHLGPWGYSGRTSRTGVTEGFNSLGFRVWGSGFRVWCLGFRVWGLGFWVWGFGV